MRKNTINAPPNPTLTVFNGTRIYSRGLDLDIEGAACRSKGVRGEEETGKGKERENLRPNYPKADLRSQRVKPGRVLAHIVDGYVDQLTTDAAAAVFLQHGQAAELDIRLLTVMQLRCRVDCRGPDVGP